MLKHCPSCNSNVLWKFIFLDTQYAWKENVTCTACGLCGSICNMCPRSKIFINKKQIQSHNGYHNRQKNNVTKTTNIDIDTNLDTHFLDNFDCFGCDFSLDVSVDETHSLGPSPMGTTFAITNEDESCFSEERLPIGAVFNTTNQDESHLSEEHHEDNSNFGYTESSITAIDDNNRPNLCNTIPEDSFLSKSSIHFIQLLSTHQNISIADCTIVVLVAHSAKKN